MLRFRLEPADLLAVRFETRPGPLEDVGCASRALRQRRVRHLAEWRALVVPRLPPDAAVALMLQPPTGVSFGFTAPMGYQLEDGLQAVQSVPRCGKWCSRWTGPGPTRSARPAGASSSPPSPWLFDEIRVQHLDDGPLKISYPTRLPLRIDPRPGRSLGRLLGGTRARLLAALSTETGPGPGTSALAAELGISAPTASEHLSVLREARLITTRRGPNGATHNLTSAGHHLLSLNFQ